MGVFDGALEDMRWYAGSLVREGCRCSPARWAATASSHTSPLVVKPEMRTRGAPVPTTRTELGAWRRCSALSAPQRGRCPPIAAPPRRGHTGASECPGT